VAPVDPAADPVDPAAQDRVAPVAARVDLAGPARVVQVSLGIRVDQAVGMAATGREVMSRVVPEDTDLAVLAVTIPVDPVDPVDPGNRVGLGDRVVLASPVALAGTTRVVLAVTILAARGRMVRVLRAQGPRGRAAQALNPDPVLLDLMPTVPDRAQLDRTRAVPDLMPAHLVRMCPVDRGPMRPVDLRRGPTTRAEAMRREAQPRPADRTLRLEVTRRVAPARLVEVTLRVAAILAAAAAAILPAERALIGFTAMVLASRSGAWRVTDRERLCARAFQGDLRG
jgi:hypothetical protein